MLPTYKALLKDNHLDWVDEEPEGINRQQAVMVYVTIVPEGGIARGESFSDGKRMAEVLNDLAERNALSEITDPVAWQRQLRQDQPLPDRD